MGNLSFVMWPGKRQTPSARSRDPGDPPALPVPSREDGGPRPAELEVPGSLEPQFPALVFLLLLGRVGGSASSASPCVRRTPGRRARAPVALAPLSWRQRLHLSPSRHDDDKMRSEVLLPPAPRLCCSNAAAPFRSTHCASANPFRTPHDHCH